MHGRLDRERIRIGAGVTAGGRVSLLVGSGGSRMDSGMTRQGRIEELLASFAELDDRLRRRKLRGHVYLTGKTAVAFAVRTNDAGEVEYLGAGTVEEAITETRGGDAAGDWLTEVGETFGAADRRTVAPAVWNTPHLVVTGAGASHAAAAKLRSEQRGRRGSLS